MVKLSVIIPAYNEVPCLATSVHELMQYLKARYDSFAKETEIILVIDGATDGTLEMALQLAQAYPNLQVIVNLPNKGKGFSVRRGMVGSTRSKMRLYGCRSQYPSKYAGWDAQGAGGLLLCDRLKKSFLFQD